MRIFILLAVISIILAAYTFFWLRRVFTFWGVDAERKSIRLLCIILAVIISVIASNFISVPGIIALHVLIACAVLEGLGWLLKKLPALKEKKEAAKWVNRICSSGLAGILIAALIIGYGYYNMNHVICTEYHFTTDKPLQKDGYRIALISDTHFGSVQDKHILQQGIQDISAQAPDIVILAGDIVEEGTSYEELQEVFQLLSGISNRYGIYYVYGNHDRQPYTNSRTYTDEQLAQAITDNHIQILKDTFVSIQDEILLAGRDDGAWGNVRERPSSEEILAGADTNKYIIMADHQPVEIEENIAQGVDLQVSGHTHGGQIWPVGLLTELLGQYNYGNYSEKNNFELVVSSGYAGWRYPIRTGKHCEFVMITVKNPA